MDSLSKTWKGRMMFINTAIDDISLKIFRNLLFYLLTLPILGFLLAVDNLSPIETSALFHENLFANNADALYNIGVDLHNLGRYEEATTYYDKGLAIDPNNIEALNGKGTTLHDLGEYNFLHHRL